MGIFQGSPWRRSQKTLLPDRRPGARVYLGCLLQIARPLRRAPLSSHSHIDCEWGLHSPTIVPNCCERLPIEQRSTDCPDSDPAETKPLCQQRLIVRSWDHYCISQSDQSCWLPDCEAHSWKPQVRMRTTLQRCRTRQKDAVENIHPS